MSSKYKNKDLPPNIEDELVNDLEESLNILKSKKEKTTNSFIMSDTKLSIKEIESEAMPPEAIYSDHALI